MAKGFIGDRAAEPELDSAGGPIAPANPSPLPEPIAPTLERPSGSERKPSRTSLLGVGSDLGPYRLQQLLGAGGMGQVYLAEHRRLGRQVAIKLLLPELSEDPEMIRRFFHEARVVNQIKHENIVEISDFVEEAGGLNYLIMEFLDGQNLTHARRRGEPFEIRRIIHILDQVCSALEVAHAKGVVHRDLKPDNIFLIQRTGRDDFVKLLDFGIAKMTAFTALNTRVGAVLGTPVYMAPEQAEGRALDGRADLYSLGVLLHWMLFDELPARAALKSPTLASVRTNTTSRSERIPAALLDVMVHCLRFEPDERPPDAASVRRALLAIEPGSGPHATAPRTRSRLLRPAILFAAAVGLIAAGAAATLRNWSPAPTAPAVVAPAPVPAAPSPVAVPLPEPAPNPSLVAPAPVPATPQPPAPIPARSTKRSRTSSPVKVLAVPAPEKKPPGAPRPEPDSEDGMMNPYAK